MSEGFAYIDILFFAMVAAFIALRLRSVLGRRTGHERRRTGGFGPARSNGAADNVVALPDRSGPVTEVEPEMSEVADARVKVGLSSDSASRSGLRSAGIPGRGAQRVRDDRPSL